MSSRNPFTPDEITALKELARREMHRQSAPVRVELDRRETVTKTCRLPKQLVEDAVKKGKEKNFNRLVERLLWETVNCDAKYLTPPREETDTNRDTT